MTNPLSYEIGIFVIRNFREYRDEDFFYQKCLNSFDSEIAKSSIFGPTFEDSYKLQKYFLDQSKAIFIHGIQYFDGQDIEPLILGGHLWDEYNLYKESQCEIKNYKTTIEVFSNDIQETEDYEILKTPYDWTGFNLPQSNFTAFSDENKPSTILDYIALGESKNLEFKPSIFYDYSKQKKGSGLPCAIPICAFLNSEGGILCVGVSDDKTLQGIEDDLSLFPDNCEDTLKLHFDQLIQNFFEPFVHNYIETRVASVEDIKLFLVFVKPSDEPVFIKIYKNNRLEHNFYIRREASNQKLECLDEFFKFVKVRWFL